MRIVVVVLAVMALVVAAQAGGDASWWDLDDARSALKLEIQVDKSGRHVEFEYHVSPASVPPAVREAMDRLHPGGPYTAAEKEFEGGHLYYELTRKVDGRDVEAMFTADGVLHAEEVEVSADVVSRAAQGAVADKYAAATVNKWEEIRGRDRQLVEYHVKLTLDGRNLKVIVTPGGFVARAYLEIPAEIEVPVPVPH